MECGVIGDIEEWRSEGSSDLHNFLEGRILVDEVGFGEVSEGFMGEDAGHFLIEEDVIFSFFEGFSIEEVASDFRDLVAIFFSILSDFKAGVSGIGKVTALDIEAISGDGNESDTGEYFFGMEETFFRVSEEGLFNGVAIDGL